MSATMGSAASTIGSSHSNKLGTLLIPTINSTSPLCQVADLFAALSGTRHCMLVGRAGRDSDSIAPQRVDSKYQQSAIDCALFWKRRKWTHLA